MTTTTHSTAQYITKLSLTVRFVVVFVVTAWYNIMTFQECLSRVQFTASLLTAYTRYKVLQNF